MLAKAGPGVSRTGWDSNPRYVFAYTHFPGVRLKPLGHPSPRLRTTRASCRQETAHWHSRPIRTHMSSLRNPGTDRVRFELTIPLPVCRFSRPVPSTARPPVRELILSNGNYRPGGAESTRPEDRSPERTCSSPLLHRRSEVQAFFAGRRFRVADGRKRSAGRHYRRFSEHVQASE